MDVSEEEFVNISSGSTVDASFSKIKNILRSVISPITEIRNEFTETADTTKVKIGIRITAEGNFVVAKASTQTHLEIEFTFK